MREILFRGKDQHTGEWVYGHFYTTPYAGNDNKTINCHFISDPNSYGSNMVLPETVGQFIGLTDKNGKKVFEGDILRRWNTYSSVEYGAFNCSCCDGVYGWYLNDDDIRSLDGIGNSFEVAGNIHDNPELLGGTDHE